MRRCVAILAVLGLTPSPAWASDIASAIDFARDVMGDDIAQGYEDLVAADENEALDVLLGDAVIDGKNDRGFETLGPDRSSYTAIRPHLDEAANETGIPVALLDAVIRTESGYRPNAVSKAGARGLMQLMPETAKSVGVYNIFDPRENVLGGARYLRRMYDQFGSWRLAIAAYNAGPGAVKKHNGVPPFKETRLYVETVLRRFEESGLR